MRRGGGAAAFADAVDSDDVPRAFTCPITCALLGDPVLAADGHSYERTAIERWLSSHATSPRTNATLDHKMLTANHTLRGAIEQWSERHPSR